MPHINFTGLPSGSDAPLLVIVTAPDATTEAGEAATELIIGLWSIQTLLTHDKALLHVVPEQHDWPDAPQSIVTVVVFSGENNPDGSRTLQ